MNVAPKILLRGPRQALHSRVADALEQHFADIVERQPELLAHHLSAAGVTKRAVEYWFRAGEHAAKRSANREAAAHFRAGLQLVEQVADDGARDAWELRLSIALGPALMTTTSSAGPEVAGVYARARQLARQAGCSVELFRALWGSWLSAFSAGDSSNAGAFVEELFALAQQEASEELTLQAHHAGWTTAMFLRGDLQAAQRYADAGIPLYRREASAHHAQLYGGHDPGVCGHGVAGIVAALGGHLDRALFEANEALALGRALSHHGSLAHAFWTASEVHYLRRDPAAICDLAAEMMPFVTEHGSAVAVASAIMFQGWALVAGGRVDEGVASLRDGLSRWRQTGSKSLGPFRLARVADGLLLAGDSAEAASLLAEAAVIAEETGEHWSDPELDRLCGVAQLRQPDGAADLGRAEYYLSRAIKRARERSARLIELRAATSLARFRGEQGRRSEARDLLAPIYGWFTEGFDTSDLKEAKAVLNEL